MLIGLAGAAGCGKDTLADQFVLHDVYEKYRFADPIKAMLAQFHIRPDVWEDHAQKEKPIPWLGKSPRYMAQTLGTEWGREMINPDIWVLLAKGRWNVVNANSDGGRLVVSDVRFPNEARWIRKAGGILIHVDRPASTHVIDNPGHVTENGVPAGVCHVQVTNDGTPEDLRKKAWIAVRAYLGMSVE